MRVWKGRAALFGLPVCLHFDWNLVYLVLLACSVKFFSFHNVSLLHNIKAIMPSRTKLYYHQYYALYASLFFSSLLFFYCLVHNKAWSQVGIWRQPLLCISISGSVDISRVVGERPSQYKGTNTSIELKSEGHFSITWIKLKSECHFSITWIELTSEGHFSLVWIKLKSGGHFSLIRIKLKSEGHFSLTWIKSNSEGHFSLTFD